MFTDADTDHGDDIVVSATLEDGSPLPAWLTFDPQTLGLPGYPGRGGPGNPLGVRGRDRQRGSDRASTRSPSRWRRSRTCPALPSFNLRRIPVTSGQPHRRHRRLVRRQGSGPGTSQVPTRAPAADQGQVGQVQALRQRQWPYRRQQVPQARHLPAAAACDAGGWQAGSPGSRASPFTLRLLQENDKAISYPGVMGQGGQQGGTRAERSSALAGPVTRSR